MHKIDLKNYEIRTDMAIDLVDENKELIKEEYQVDGIKSTWILLDKNNVIKKDAGRYLTIEFDDITDTEFRRKVSNVFKKEFEKMLSYMNFKKTFKTLVIGLGNEKSTPDSLGPFVSNKVIVTKHLYDMNASVDKNYSNVSTFYPGVTGTTGIETSLLIKGVVNEVKPDLVIVIDSLASSSISRVNKSIQVTNAGISPGSGIGNKRKEISEKTLGIPVIAVGVPTVASASVIVCDTISYMIKNYAYNKNKKQNKLVVKPVNYLKNEVDASIEDKEKLLGLVGTLNKEELMSLTYEVLEPIGYNLMVTPKEVDFMIEKLSDVISYGINHSLHNI